MKALPLILAFFLVSLIACSQVVVQRGDTVQLTYTGAYTNGTIFDTNDKANLAVFPADASHFTPLTVTVGRGEVIRGFENALPGMEEGQTKTVTIKAVDAYGSYDAEKVIKFPRELTYPLIATVERTVAVPISGLAAKNVGDEITTKNFVYRYDSKNTTHGVLYTLGLKEGLNDTVQLDTIPWTSTLIATTKDTFTFRHNAAIASQLVVQDAPFVVTKTDETTATLSTPFVVGRRYEFSQGSARATRESDQYIYLDFNHQLAGQDLVFTITVNTIQPVK
jgi:FKBP-type peptidyl-prolyl cis-trans isomerase 2